MKTLLGVWEAGALASNYTGGGSRLHWLPAFHLLA